jgi:isoleucyl-tRNA synthetase
MGKLANEIKNLSKEDLDSYLAKGLLKLKVDGQDFELYENDIEIITEAKEGFVAQKDKSLIVALNIVLTENLLTEGFAREFVNRVQNLRKEAEFEVTDHIEIEVTNGSDDIYQKLKDQKDYICNETLADNIKFNKLDSLFFQDVKINDESLRIGLQKVN